MLTTYEILGEEYRAALARGDEATEVVASAWRTAIEDGFEDDPRASRASVVAELAKRASSDAVRRDASGRITGARIPGRASALTRWRDPRGSGGFFGAGD